MQTIRLLSATDVALQLQCSTRHIYRLADGGKIPAPIRVGTLVRWVAQDIDDWLVGGCPSLPMETK